MGEDKGEIVMVDYPIKYYLDEVRDGFFVSSWMKKAWAVDYQGYLDLKDTCDRLGIICTGTWGTLLGAVRHGGYIPWDDDIDIAMSGREYRILKKEEENYNLPKDYWISDYVWNQDENFARKWIGSKYLQLDYEHTIENYGFPIPTVIDVFLMDYIPKDVEEREVFGIILQIIVSLKDVAVKIDNYEAMDDAEVTRFLQLLGKLEELIDISFDLSEDRENPLYIQLLQALEMVCSQYDETNSKDIAMVVYWMGTPTRLFPSICFQDTVEVDYEIGKMLLPIGYDGVLRRLWSGFMFPVVEFSGHGYPAYEEMEDEIVSKGGNKLFKYHVNLEQIKEILNQKNTTMQSKINKKKKVVFLPFCSEDWKVLHTIWEVAVFDDIDVKVIPVPYYMRAFDGSVIDEDIFDVGGYPDEVALTDYMNYSFEQEKPDIVIFQCPYDEYSCAMMVHPDYFISYIRMYSQKLIMIPSFVLREIEKDDIRAKKMLKDYTNNIGSILADVIVVQSDKMKEVYIDILEKFTESELDLSKLNDNICAGAFEWKNKVIGLGSALYDWKARSRVVLRNESEDSLHVKGYGEIPEAITYDKIINISPKLHNKLKKSDWKLKKVLLYTLGGSMLLEHGEDEVRRADDAIKVFANYKDEIVVLWALDKYAEKILRENATDTWKAYQDLVDKYSDVDYVDIYSYSDDRYSDSDLATIADAYYGDACVAMNECRVQGKPVLWETPGSPVEASDKYKNKTWNEDILVAVEGEADEQWNLMNFIEEALSYEVKKPSDGNGKRIWEQIRKLLII